MTALEELIKWLKGFEDDPIKPTNLRVKEKAQELLEKERQQIIDAYNSADRDAMNVIEFKPIIFEGAEDYYNKTYKK